MASCFSENKANKVKVSKSSTLLSMFTQVSAVLFRCQVASCFSEHRDNRIKVSKSSTVLSNVYTGVCCVVQVPGDIMLQ